MQPTNLNAASSTVPTAQLLLYELQILFVQLLVLITIPVLSLPFVNLANIFIRWCISIFVILVVVFNNEAFANLEGQT